MTGQFTTQLGFEDYLAANWLRIRRRWIWRGSIRFLAIVVPAYFCLGISTAVIDQTLTTARLVTEAVTALVLGLAVWLGLALYWWWSVPRSARKIFAEQPLIATPVSFQFDDLGLKVSNERESSDLLWQHILNWIEDDRLLILSRTRLTFLVIPKNQIEPTVLQAFKDKMIAATVKEGI